MLIDTFFRRISSICTNINYCWWKFTFFNWWIL